MNIRANDLRAFVKAIFVGVGCSEAESGRIAQHLVEANLVGHDSHGVIRVPRYVTWLQEGKLKADQDVSVVFENDAMLVLDGNFGMGQTVGPQAVSRGIEKAADSGVAIVALRHAGHLGRIGDWAIQAAEAGQVSVHFVNVAGSVLVAPFGGVERRMSTAPVAIGMPVPDAPPVILDFATSVVAEGKVLVASKGGATLPDGALITGDGKLSSDPATLYGDVDATRSADVRGGDGAIRAMGDHKGSGLALMCELLAGALAGSGCTSFDAPRIYNGMLSIYMSTDHFDTGNHFAPELKRYLDFFRSAKPAESGGEVLLPGEPEERRKKTRLAEGVPLADDAWGAIVEAGASVGVTPPS